jgi:antitoxin ParD1/3/4
MTRQSISFTNPNSEWLKLKVEVEGEYKSNSELVNALVRKERAREQAELDGVRAALILGEQSGVSPQTPDQIMQAVVERKRANGSL